MGEPTLADEDDGYGIHLVTVKGKRYSETGDQPADCCSPSDLRKNKIFLDEYYAHINAVVITPANAHELLALPNTKQWDFWELFSGTAILTTCSKRAGLRVGPPIDSRHGWDLSIREHQ